MNKIHPLISIIDNNEIDLSYIDNETYDKIISVFDNLCEEVVWRYELTKNIDNIINGLRFTAIYDIDDVQKLCAILNKGSLRLLFEGSCQATQRMYQLYERLDAIQGILSTLICTNSEKRCQYTLNI